MPLSSIAVPGLPFPPYRLSGTVVGALLNDPAELAALGEAAHRPPHKAPPVAPVLEVKPRHTLAGDGAEVVLPAGSEALATGAQLAIVLGRTAHRVAEAGALAHVAGYTVANVFHVPHDSHYRPAARQRARDGFCVLGPAVVPAGAVADPDALAVTVAVDGTTVQATTTGGRTRGVARLIADVSAFMTLHPGDVLLLGASHGAPRVRAGQSVAVTIAGVGTLACRCVAEETDAGMPA